MECDHRFPLTHFVRNVFGRTFGDTRSAGFGGFGHLVTDSLCKLSVFLSGYQHIKIINCHFYQQKNLNARKRRIFRRVDYTNTICKSIKKRSDKYEKCR